MAIPLVHPAAPVVTQTAQTCWACAFESGSRANNAMFGTSGGPTSRDLIGLFHRNPGLNQGHTERASAEGMRILSRLGLMDMRGFHTSRLRLETLGAALERATSTWCTSGSDARRTRWCCSAPTAAT